MANPEEFGKIELIKNIREAGRLFVTKLSAAERQLSAAIRMYFLELDALAVHTVASASYNLYADLLRDRGKEEAAWPIMYGILRAAKDYVNEHITHEELSSWGEETLSILEPYIDFFKKQPHFDIDQFKVSASPELARAYWAEKRKSYNFLKHADHDAASLLDEADVNNEDLIIRSINASLHLNCQITAEKEAFYSAMYGMGRLRGPKPDLHYASIFEVCSEAEIMTVARRTLCYDKWEDVDVDDELVRRVGQALESWVRGSGSEPAGDE